MSGPAEESAQQKDRRRRVVTAAMTMAAEGGYDAVHMRQVAERSGVALGTIYRYFNSKDQMLLAGLAGWTAAVRDDLLASPPKGDSSAERLAAVLCEASHRTDEVPVLMGALVTALASTDEVLLTSREQITAAWGDIVDHAVKSESVDGVDLDAVKRIVGHVWFSSICAWVSGQAPTGSVCEELRFVSYTLLDRS
jgi:AcrR family transcriptional regulator